MTFRIDPLPDDDACISLMLDAMRDAAQEVTDSLPYLAPYKTLPARFHIISDYDDYIPAATYILDAIANAFLAHTHESPRTALSELLDDEDFLQYSSTADFGTPLFDLIHESDDEE